MVPASLSLTWSNSLNAFIVATYHSPLRRSDWLLFKKEQKEGIKEKRVWSVYGVSAVSVIVERGHLKRKKATVRAVALETKNGNLEAETDGGYAFDLCAVKDGSTQFRVVERIEVTLLNTIDEG